MKATGQIRHCWFGEYSARVALQFETQDDAETALGALNIGRENWIRSGKACVTMVDNAGLTSLEERLRDWGLAIAPCGRSDCAHQCKDANIDAVNHSIDFGPVFTVDIKNPESKDQTKFEFAEA